MKKIGSLCLALVLALGSLGIGYAAWTEDLLIDGTVETGTIGAAWSPAPTASDDEIHGKDYSSITATVVGDTMTVTVLNAYPSITYTVLWSITNTGSIPVDFAAPVIDRGDLPTGTTITFTGTGLSGVPAAIVWPVQVHPDDVLTGNLTIHLGSDTVQDADYEFSLDLDYGQWNLFPPAP